LVLVIVVAAAAFEFDRDTVGISFCKYGILPTLAAKWLFPVQPQQGDARRLTMSLMLDGVLLKVRTQRQPAACSYTMLSNIVFRVRKCACHHRMQ
jgi:hypothetical protein